MFLHFSSEGLDLIVLLVDDGVESFYFLREHGDFVFQFRDPPVDVGEIGELFFQVFVLGVGGF
jgi:hypothetical protein